MPRCQNERKVEMSVKERMCEEMEVAGIPEMIHLAIHHAEIGLEVYSPDKKPRVIQQAEHPCSSITYVDARGGETPSDILDISEWDEDLDGYGISAYLIHGEAPELSREAAEHAIAGGMTWVVRCIEDTKGYWSAFLSPRTDVIYRERQEGNPLMRKSLG